MHWPIVVDDYISLDRPFLGITLAYYLHLVSLKKGVPEGSTMGTWMEIWSTS